LVQLQTKFLELHKGLFQIIDVIFIYLREDNQVIKVY